MNDNKFLRLNTVFQLPKNVAKAAISLSQQIGKIQDTFFTLDGLQFYPHITIYSPEYPVDNLDDIISSVGELAKSSKHLVFDAKGITTHQDFITISLEASPDVQKIHAEIVNKLNPLRAGQIREKYQQATYSPEQQENIKKYGYPNVLELYHPHITITRLKDEGVATKIAGGLEWVIPGFTVNKIAVYEMGKYGTCVALIKEFNLSNQSL